MKKFFVIFAFLFSIVFGDQRIEVVGNIAVLKHIDDAIYAGTDAGKLFKFDRKNNQIELIFTLPQIKSYIDGQVDSKVIDMDKFGDKFALLIDDDYMHKALGIYENGELKKFAPPITGIKRIFFLDENTMILLGIGSEILYFDIKSQKVTFSHKISDSPFGGVAFDRQKNLLLLSNEGGMIYFFDTKNKKFLREKSIHKDNIFSVAMNKNRVITGSNDKTCYYENASAWKFFNAGFLVYSVALNDEFGAFSVEDGINIIDTKGNIIKKIPYDGEIINYLIFYGDYLVGAGYDKTIHFWSFK